jgi:phosphoenolpyruvate---glycerone phosphotransferase subunit DhaL
MTGPTTAESVRARLDATVGRLRAVVADAEPLLTALDEASGDGDFGSNLDEGLARVQTRVAAGESGWPALVGVFLDEVGGTSGPLFGLLFQSVGLAALSAEDYLGALAHGLREGLTAIQRVGEAQVGDRTLVDALAPAVAALLERPGDAAAMVRAGVDGALGTAGIRARRGRSSYVGDKALGFPDPGAVGIALLLTVLAEPVLGAAVPEQERARLLQQ